MSRRIQPRVILTGMECRVCGAPLDVSDARCASCGALAVADDELWQAARAADEPTQVMPAVERPRGPIATDSPPTAGFAPPLVPPQAAPPPLEPAPAMAPPPAEEARPPDAQPSVLMERPRGMWREVMIAAIGGALALVVLTGVWAIANRPSISPEAVAAAPPDSSATPDAVASVSCDPSSLSATSTGRWRLYEAEFGPRDRIDFLRLRMRREGDHEQTPHVTAELVAPGDVQTRYELDVPAGDQALVLAFNGSVGIGGTWGATPGYRGLREFRVTRGREGNVYLVAGIVGRGCFAMSGGWDADESEIRIEIERP